MNALRVVIGLAGLALFAVIVWAIFGPDYHGDFLSQFQVIVTLPWGVVSLVDLYVGLLIFATIVFLTERSWLKAALWALPVFVLGNVWTAVWFVLRLPYLVERLTKDPPAQ
ncbi:MAG: DUF1475 domain-containing protein [Alphaproteobacteria bacterium]|nr:DUF1475 domain-containing protein [Alphaproteobacteria bacterium]